MIHCYKLGGFNIVLDTPSGCVHYVDAAAYDAIRLYEDGGREGLISKIIDKNPEITEAEALELIDDIEELKLRKKLFAPDIYSDLPGLARKTTLKALCMNVSHLCNMSCAYCFASSGKYGGGGELMPLGTGKRAIDFLVENSEGRKKLDVDFFGGEPLLNWDTVKDIVKYARSIERGANKEFRFTLTTNGLLIDSDVIEFTNKEMDNVVLSLDGRPETNDAFRKLPDGGGSFRDVFPKHKALVQARQGRQYYIRGTFTNNNLNFSDDILYLADLGFSELSMEPVVAKQGSPYGLTKDDLPKLFEQYELLAAEMLKREKEGKGFTFYHFMIDLTSGPCIYKRLSGCGVGREYLAVTPRGELYPCHQFVGDGNFLMGDIWRGVTNEKLRDEFGGCDIYSRTECVNCWARIYCSGGCAANAYNISGSVNGVYELGCELFKKRIECAIMMKTAISAYNQSCG